WVPRRSRFCRYRGGGKKAFPFKPTHQMADRTTSKTRSKESTSRSSNDSSRASSNGRGNGSATAKGGSSSSSNKAKGKESQEGLMKLFLDSSPTCCTWRRSW